ncbi:MAG: hypothetical protein RIT45_924 [Pseudomonadota bacterium]|jgi:hypothetical protein
MSPSSAGADARFALRPDAARREVDGAYFFVTADRGMHRVAVASGVAIVRALAEQPRTVDDLVGELAHRFDAEEATIRAETERFLRMLLEKQIVEVRA